MKISAVVFAAFLALAMYFLLTNALAIVGAALAGGAR